MEFDGHFARPGRSPGQTEIEKSVADPYVIEAKGLKISFQVGRRSIRALKGISLGVRPGIVTGLIGPDGAGKTTFMRLCAGLMAPTAGELKVLGLDPARQEDRLHQLIGYMPQRFGLYEDLTVQENLDLYADLQGYPLEKRPERYGRLMEMTGLARFTGRLAGRLSGGMKQKLGLACSLIRPPRLLILDEPTVGVDPVSRRELWQIIYNQVEELGMSVLVSTAYLDEAERCQEVILIHEGRILGIGEPDSFSRPLAGYCFMLTPPLEKRRALQLRLSAMDGVVDALILGARVRLVTQERMGPEEVRRVFEIPDDVSIEQVPPRFEDAFMSLLRAQMAEAPRVSEARHRRVAGPRDQVVIRVKDLKRRFGEFYAVSGISFEVRRGEIFGLLGANGAGKSTTFRMLCGLLPPTSGTVEVAGADLGRSGPEARKGVGYMAQKFSLYEDLTSLQNLEFFSRAYGLDGERRREQIAWAMETFELNKMAGIRSRNLPLGYKQRLQLAAALMHEPDVLFLDEPTSGVDPITRREFWRHINMLAEAGVTIMVTTHFLEEAEYCDRMVIMADGKILDSGSPEEIKARCADERHPFPTMEDAFIRLIEEYQGTGRKEDGHREGRAA